MERPRLNPTKPAKSKSVPISVFALSLALTLALVLLPACSLADEPPAPWGPAFGQRSLYILHVPILELAPADPEPLDPLRTRWAFESGYANSFSHSWHAPLYHGLIGPPGTPFRRDEAERIHRDFGNETAWFVDGEVLRTTLKGSVGIAPAFFVSVEVPYVSYSAVDADRSIGSFHSAFGLSPAGRADFPTGAFVVMTQPANGALGFDTGNPSSGFGDVTGSLSWRPPPRGSGVSYGGDVVIKAPTGSAADFNGSGDWDAGALLFLARSGRKWRLAVEAGVVVPGDSSTAVAIPTAPFGRVQLDATLRLGQKTRIGATCAYEQSPFRNARLGPVSQPGAEFALGIERDFSRISARALVTENISKLGDRADIGLTLRLTYRPGR